MTKVILSGNTYGIRQTLKGLGFRWDSKAKVWIAVFKDDREAEEIAHRWYSEGVYAKLYTSIACP